MSPEMNNHDIDLEFRHDFEDMDEYLYEDGFIPLFEISLVKLKEALNAINLTLSEDLLISLKADPEVFEKFVANCYEQNKSGHKEYLSEAFRWVDTPEGYDVWFGLSQRFTYEKLAREAQNVI